MSARSLAFALVPLARVPGVAIVLAVLSTIFGLTSPGFATPANIANILTQSTILLLLALPMTVIIMTEGLDLSMGASHLCLHRSGDNGAGQRFTGTWVFRRAGGRILLRLGQWPFDCRA